MHDSRSRPLTRQADCAAGGVTRFAAEVVARLVSRDSGVRFALQPKLLDRLTEAVETGGAEGFEALKPELKRARISAAMLADGYIPEIARRMGQAWEDDRLTFAEVTMALARLQAILREIGSGWAADASGLVGAQAAVLLIVPEGEQHTLGALVMTGQLRRQGVSVCLRIGPKESDLRAMFARRQFDGAMLSLASEDRLEACKQLVQLLRDLSRNRIRIALGGNVVNHDAGALARRTGVDVVTNDLEAALSALHLVQAGARVSERV